MPTPKHEQDDPKALYRNGTLTRAGMERVIEGGGSVVHQAKIYTRIEDLPDEATLTEGDAAAAEAAEMGIQQQIATLASQAAALRQTRDRAVRLQGLTQGEERKPEMERQVEAEKQAEEKGREEQTTAEKLTPADQAQPADEGQPEEQPTAQQQASRKKK
jgi:hypothetical protein